MENVLNAHLKGAFFKLQMFKLCLSNQSKDQGSKCVCGKNIPSQKYKTSWIIAEDYTVFSMVGSKQASFSMQQGKISVKENIPY